MNGSRGSLVAVGLLAMLVGAGIAAVAYNAGTQHAVTDGGRVFTTPANAQVVYVRPWGFGFGFFLPFLFIALFFAVLRGMFWRGRYHRWHHHGQCGPGAHRDDSPGPDVTGATV